MVTILHFISETFSLSYYFVQKLLTSKVLLKEGSVTFFPFSYLFFLKLDCITSIRLSTVATTTIFFSFNLSVAFVQVRIDYVNCREATVLVRPTPAEAHLLDIQIDQVRLNKEVEAPKIKISLNWHYLRKTQKIFIFIFSTSPSIISFEPFLIKNFEGLKDNVFSRHSYWYKNVWQQ